MEWYSILGVLFKSILWTFLVFCVTWCFVAAYKYWLRCCFGLRRRQDVTANSSGAGVSLPERGLMTLEIDEFPKFRYRPEAKGGSDGVEMSREITECVICLGAFKEAETLRLITMCGHIFHADCVDVWLQAHATCPCCRAYLKLQGKWWFLIAPNWVLCLIKTAFLTCSLCLVSIDIDILRAAAAAHKGLCPLIAGFS